MLDVARAKSSSSTIPIMVTTNPSCTRVRWARRLAMRSANTDDNEDTDSRGGQHQPCVDGAEPPDLLQEHRDHKEAPLHDQPLYVLSHEAQVGEAVME